MKDVDVNTERTTFLLGASRSCGAGLTVHRLRTQTASRRIARSQRLYRSSYTAMPTGCSITRENQEATLYLYVQMAPANFLENNQETPRNRLYKGRMDVYQDLRMFALDHAGLRRRRPRTLYNKRWMRRRTRYGAIPQQQSCKHEERGHVHSRAGAMNSQRKP